METHIFYCTHCGRKGLNVWRNTAAQRGRGHLKKLWCPYCNQEYNHYECYDETDEAKFKMKFERGDFKNDSLENHVGSSRKR